MCQNVGLTTEHKDKLLNVELFFSSLEKKRKVLGVNVQATTHLDI